MSFVINPKLPQRSLVTGKTLSKRHFGMEVESLKDFNWAFQITEPMKLQDFEVANVLWESR